jgi:hypothetical protein
LNLAIQFRDDHGPTALIPNDLVDELLQGSDDGKYYCFCCPRARKSRTITPARDHVRKSLGNFPFRCPNSWWYVSLLWLIFLIVTMIALISVNTPPFDRPTSLNTCEFAPNDFISPLHDALSNSLGRFVSCYCVSRWSCFALLCRSRV